MSTLTSNISLKEIHQRLDPKGMLTKLIDVNSREMPILDDMPWAPTNGLLTNKTTQVISKPAGAVRRFDQGVAVESGRTTEILDTCTSLEAQSEIDERKLDIAPDSVQFRFNELALFFSGILETFVTQILYGNTYTTPDEMRGLQPRLGTIDTTYVYGAGGSGGDTTSIYIVSWDPILTYMGYPANDPQIGVKHTDRGRQRVIDGSSNPYYAWADTFNVTGGFINRDPRRLGRVGNIESGASATSNIFDEDLLIRIMNKMKTGPGTRLYCNETVKSQMEIALKDKNNVNYTASAGEGLAGEPMLRFRGFPVRKIDSEILLNTEATITT